MRVSQRRKAFAPLLFLGMAGVFGVTFRSPLWSQTQNTNRVLGTAQTDEEFEAYQLAVKSHAPQEAARNAEGFLKEYPNSGLSPYVHKVAVIAYQQLNDREKVISHGEAMLKDLPDNVAVLAILAQAYVESDDPAKAISRAETALKAFSGMPRPASITDTEWQARRDTIESNIRLSLGTAELTMALEDDRPNQKNEALGRAVENLQKSLASNPQLDAASYRLGLAYLAKNDQDAAAKYFAWTVALGESLSKTGEAKLEQVCQAQGKALHPTIDDLVARAHRDLQKKRQQEREAASPVVPPHE